MAAAYEWRKLRVRLNRIFGAMPGSFGTTGWNEVQQRLDQAIDFTEREAIHADRLRSEKR